MWKQEKWYRWTYLQGKNRDTDVENRHVVTAGKGEGETNWESSVQLLSHVWLFANPWTTAHQASLSITNSRSPLKPMSIKSVIPSNHFILCHPLLLLLSIFLASGSFPVSQFFTSGFQSIGVCFSFSISPSNEYSGLISFRIKWFGPWTCSPKNSQECFPTL